MIKKKNNTVKISNSPAYLEKNIGSKIFDTANFIVLSLITLSCILPIWYTFCVSLSSKSAAEGGLVGLWPVDVTLESYISILDDTKFFDAFGVSVMRVLLGTVVTIAIILLMAYPLSKTKVELPARNIIMWLLVFCMMFNGGLVPWFMTMTNIGMLNNIWGLVLGGGVPVFNVILVINFFRNIPKQIEEAAVVDGAGPWTILFKLIIPISKPVIATVSLFTAVMHWNEFFNGLVLNTDSSKYPLQTYIQQLVVNTNAASLTVEELKMLTTMSNQTLNAAKLFIAMLPVLIVYPFLQRYFVTGITLGSVKE